MKKTFNGSFKRKTEIAQYKAALMISGAIKGTSCGRLYQELGLESLADGRWFRRVFFSHKIKPRLLRSYLQTYYNAVSEGQHRIKLSQSLQEPKYLRILCSYITLRNGVNTTTKLEI